MRVFSPSLPLKNLRIKKIIDNLELLSSRSGGLLSCWRYEEALRLRCFGANLGGKGGSDFGIRRGTFTSTTLPYLLLSPATQDSHSIKSYVNQREKRQRHTQLPQNTVEMNLALLFFSSLRRLNCPIEWNEAKRSLSVIVGAGRYWLSSIGQID